MNDPGLTELLLAGYVRLTGRGFALPCFAASAKSNAWYTAICTVDADHAGQVSGFEVFESNDIIPIRPELQRRVSIGSSWIDVFLWKQEVIVGTPQEIWEGLVEEREEMLATVPLSGLDLALGIPGQNVTALVGSAIDFMRDHFGPEKARAWRYGTLARHQLLIGLRRLAREAGLGQEAMAAIGSLEISPLDDDRLNVQVPPNVVAQFAKANRSEALDHRIRETTARLGLIAIDAPVEPENAPEQSLPEAEGKPTSAEELRIDDTLQESYGAIRVLIMVAEGRRVRNVARHLSRPEWKPDWIGLSRVVLVVDSVDRNARRSSRKFIGMPQEEHPQYFDVVVLLTDDEALTPEFRSKALSSLQEYVSRNPATVSLLAPVPPEDTPSEILVGHSGARSDAYGFDSVIDTSLARSPFWTGNPRRALDSRIADLIVGATVLCSGDSPVQRRLKQKPGRQNTLLTFALGRDSLTQAHIGLASEATWPDRSPKHGELWSIRFTATSAQSGSKPSLSGVVQIRERRERFEEFAAAVLTNLTGVHPESLIKHQLPARLRKELSWPNLSAGFRFGSTAFRGIAICSEAPALGALRAAGSERWAVLRYTDTESIKETASLGKSLQLPYLPRQLHLPKITRRPENRGLATRGIDPRDVVRLTHEEWQSWKSRLPRSLSAEIRRYRTSLFDPDQEVEFVLPRRELQKVAEAGHKAAEALLRHAFQAAGKRLADLRVAWSRPADGASRYILADGVVPCEFAELHSDEAPAQRFFIIDGDAAVPALLGSRVFAAWAKITLTRSTSWMPRFSISRTFETFPMPPPFMIAPRDDGPVQLRFATKNKRLRDRANELRSMYRKRSMDAARKLQVEIDRAILNGLNLEVDAPDLDIVELLLHAGYSHFA